MNINQLNQNEYLKQQEGSAVDGVEKFADDRISKLNLDEQKRVVKEVSDSLIAVNSEQQLAEGTTVKPTTAEWNRVAKEDVAQVGKQSWTELDKQGETWVDFA